MIAASTVRILSIATTYCALSLLRAAPAPVAATASAVPAPNVRIERLPQGAVQPQVTLDDSGVLHRVFLQGDPAAADVFYQSRTPSNNSPWSQPVRVNTEAGNAIAIGTIRGPTLALGGTNWIHILWNGSSRSQWKSTNGSPLLYSRSPVGSGTFSPELHLGRSTRHLDGGGAIAADTNGHVFALWHASGASAPDGEQHRRVFLSTSDDAGAHFSGEHPISPADHGACGCCGLAAAIASNQELHVLFRTASSSGSRDTAVLTSKDGGATFAFQILDPWKATQCPMSLPSIDTTSARVSFQWETGPTVFWSNAGMGTQPQALASTAGAKGRRKHPVSTHNREGYSILAWSEGTGWQKGGSVGWQLRGPDGSVLSNESSPATDLPVWSRPAVYFDAPANHFVIVY